MRLSLTHDACMTAADFADVAVGFQAVRDSAEAGSVDYCGTTSQRSTYYRK